MSLNGKEQQRAKVLNDVGRGGLTGEEAARLMGLSWRQVQRLLAAYRQEGVAALSHSNPRCIGAPVHRIPEHIRERAVALARGLYQGLNHHHLTITCRRSCWSGRSCN